MAQVYRTTGDWGAGKGSNLTQAEADTNFHELDTTLEGMGFVIPAGVDSITVGVDVGGGVNGRLIKFTLTDGREFGPYILPQAAFVPTGSYAAGRIYKPWDMILVDDGLYLVLEEHEGATEFDPDEAGSEGPLYYPFWLEVKEFDMAGFLPGAAWDYLAPDTPVFQFSSPRGVVIAAGTTEDPAGYVFARVAPDFDLAFDVQVNGVSVGTMTIATASQVGAFDFAADVVLLAGDVLTIEQPEIPSELPTESESATFDFPSNYDQRGLDISWTLRALKETL